MCSQGWTATQAQITCGHVIRSDSLESSTHPGMGRDKKGEATSAKVSLRDAESEEMHLEGPASGL